MQSLDNFIFIEKSVPDAICDYILEELESKRWEKHQWGSIYGGLSKKEETSKEPDVTYSKPLDSVLNSFVMKTGRKYEQMHSDKSCPVSYTHLTLPTKA